MTEHQNNFETIAEEALEGILEAIDGALGDCLDIELQGGIITIELESGAQYVISKHSVNRQIWVSSPISGASHYAYDAGIGKWANTRGGNDLCSLLINELEAAAGDRVR